MLAAQHQDGKASRQRKRKADSSPTAASRSSSRTRK